MAVEICEQTGICKVQRWEYHRAAERVFQAGMGIQGLRGISYNKPDVPCYVPELHDAVYTRNDLMALCNGQEEIAEELFDRLDWQSPSTLMDEWERTGEINICKTVMEDRVRQ